MRIGAQEARAGIQREIWSLETTMRLGNAASTIANARLVAMAPPSPMRIDSTLNFTGSNAPLVSMARTHRRRSWPASSEDESDAEVAFV